MIGEDTKKFILGGTNPTPPENKIVPTKSMRESGLRWGEDETSMRPTQEDPDWEEKLQAALLEVQCGHVTMPNGRAPEQATDPQLVVPIDKTVRHDEPTRSLQSNSAIRKIHLGSLEAGPDMVAFTPAERKELQRRYKASVASPGVPPWVLILVSILILLSILMGFALGRIM